MTEQRAAEVRAIVNDVLADADTRASLQGSGMTAGHDGSHFFIGSADGRFLLELDGQMQFRYIHNFTEGSSVSDDDDGGFQVRRAKIGFNGHTTWGDRKWEYQLVLSTERDDGNEILTDFKIATALTDNLKIMFGKYKVPFLREELTSSKRQLAVDRGLVTEFFTADRSEQVSLVYSDGPLQAQLSMHDGADEEFSTIGADPVEYAIAGRIDYAIAGSLSQIKDFNAWSSDETGIFIGGAFNYQVGDGANADNSSESDANVFGWTVDGSIEMHPLAVYLAFMGAHTDDDNGPGGLAFDRDMYGFLAQANYQVIPDVLEPFVRFEWVDTDSGASGSDDEAYFLTFGANWYVDEAKHNSKITADIVWVLDGFDSGFDSNPWGNSMTSDGLGFSGDGGSDLIDDTFLFRLQYQLLW